MTSDDPAPSTQVDGLWLTLPDVPFALRWQVAPERWQVEDDGALTITAAARTDLFVDPGEPASTLNAPRLAGRPLGDFQLIARVRAGLAATFDAGALLLYAHERAWAKLALERAPGGEPTVVSVVTHGLSDDANAFTVDGDTIWLRVSRTGPSYAFHASSDGLRWRFVRHFALDAAGRMSAGFLAQSPTGDGCSTRFGPVRFVSSGVADLRDGS